MCQDCAELGQCFWVSIWAFFSPFSLLVLGKGFFPVSSGLFFPQQSSFLAHHLLTRAAALWQHHLCPCAQLAVSCCPFSHGATCIPSSLSFPSTGTGSGFGSAQGWVCQAPPVLLCWHRGTGEQMNLHSSWLLCQGALASPHLSHCVLGGLEPSEVTAWRGAPGQLSSCPHPNQSGGDPGHCSTKTQGQWFLSLAVPPVPCQLPRVHHVPAQGLLCTRGPLGMLHLSRCCDKSSVWGHCHSHCHSKGMAQLPPDIQGW